MNGVPGVPLLGGILQGAQGTPGLFAD